MKGSMLAQVVTKFPWPWMSVIGMLLFLMVFIGALLWVFRRGSKEIYDQMASAPLEEQGVNNV